MDPSVIDSSRVPLGRVAILGCGKLGEALLAPLLAADAVSRADLIATARRDERLARLRERFGIEVTTDNQRAVEGADVVLLCVKPQTACLVLDEVSAGLGADQLLVSVVAGLKTASIAALLGDSPVPIVRAMPNTPSRVGAGMTVLCGGRGTNEAHLRLGEAIFIHAGRVMSLDESHLDAVTGLSASGPAFLYLVIEALAEGGVKVGLPRNVATELAAQTCLGAAQMVLATGDHPALLKDEVTTPAGCTVDGLLELEAGGLRVTLIKAVVEARRRARELVDGGAG